MSHASVYSSGPLRGRPIRGAARPGYDPQALTDALTTGTGVTRIWVDEADQVRMEAVRIHLRPDEPTGVRINLSDTDMDDWRDKVVWADFGGATSGDQAINDATIDAVIPADAPAPPVDWRGGRRRPRLGLPLTVILIGLAVTYFAWRIAA